MELLSIWLIFSGAFAGYLLRTGVAIIEGAIATGIAATGGLIGIWVTVIAIPGIVQLATGARLGPGEAGALVACGSGWAAFAVAYLWGALRSPRD